MLCMLSSVTLAQRKIAFTEFDLDNGLHVILHKDNSTPIVEVAVSYHVGSKNEDPERTGFAHFFEHLLFEGTENIERGQYSKLVESAGGVLNANTFFDRTYYHQTLPSNQVELGLYLESERMLHAKIDQIGVDTQNEVVKEEKRLRVDNQPYGTILQETVERAFTVHPYRWTTIGSLEHLDAATLDEFIEFYKTFYVPNNAVLVVAGDIDIKKTKELVTKYYAEIPRGTREIPRPDVVEPVRTEEVRDVVYDNIQLPAVIHAYPMPAQGTEDYYAMNMLTQILSTGRSSRMYKELVDNKELALQAAAIPLGLEDPGLFISFAISNFGADIEELEKSMDAEIAKVRNELVSDREFQKITNQVENNFVSGNSRVAGIAESLADYYLYFGNTDLINTEIERYQKVTKEDLKRVANKYLNKEARVALTYLPKSAQQAPGETEIDKN